MRNKKVLFLLHQPPPVHGSSMVGKWISDSLSINKAFECSFINLLASKTVGDSGRVSINKIIGFFNIWIRLITELLTNRPNLCYFALTSNGAAFYKDVLLVLTLKLFGIKIIYHLHNKGFSANNSYVYTKLCSFVFSGVKVVLLSDLLYYDVRPYVLKENTYICPNGIPDNKPIITFKKENKIPNLLFLSNLIESKGVYVLLDACRILKKRNIDFNCTFVGGEGDINKEDLNNQIKLHDLSNSVIYVGKKIESDKNEYFLKSDIFVFPTFYNNETFGLVNLEAMQFSLPVVSTFEGGIPDVVEDSVSGFLVQKNDAEALADKLEILIKNPPLRKQMGEEGRMKYEKEFTLETFEKRIIEILHQCLIEI